MDFLPSSTGGGSPSSRTSLVGTSYCGPHKLKNRNFVRLVSLPLVDDYFCLDFSIKILFEKSPLKRFVKESVCLCVSLYVCVCFFLYACVRAVLYFCFSLCLPMYASILLWLFVSLLFVCFLFYSSLWISVSFYLILCLPIFVFACPCFSPLIATLFVCLPVCLLVCLSVLVTLFICPSVCSSVYMSLFALCCFDVSDSVWLGVCLLFCSHFCDQCVKVFSVPCLALCSYNSSQNDYRQT